MGYWRVNRVSAHIAGISIFAIVEEINEEQRSKQVALYLDNAPENFIPSIWCDGVELTVLECTVNGTKVR